MNFVPMKFAEGFSHASQASSIDLNAVRLCFQVFLKGPDRQHIPIEPVVSDPIYDKKAMSDLVICKLSKPSSSVVGGEEIILLCEKVNLNLFITLFEMDLNYIVLYYKGGKRGHTSSFL